jgi:16S rRNA G1207 methylase RsmC
MAQDIDRDFPTALDLGCGAGYIFKTLSLDAGLGGVEMLLQCDSAENLLLRDAKQDPDTKSCMHNVYAYCISTTGGLISRAQ